MASTAKDNNTTEEPFPRREAVRDTPDLQVPFKELPGEFVCYIGEIRTALIPSSPSTSGNLSAQSQNLPQNSSSNQPVSAAAANSAGGSTPNVNTMTQSEFLPQPSTEIQGSDGAPLAASVYDFNNRGTASSLSSSSLSDAISSSGIIALSNFRLFVAFPDVASRFNLYALQQQQQQQPSNIEDALINLPLGLIEFVELRDLFHVYLMCKDARLLRVAFDNNAKAELWYRRLVTALQHPEKPEKVFAYAHFSWGVRESYEELRQLATSVEHNATTSDSSTSPDVILPYEVFDKTDWFSREVSRLKFDLHVAWRVTEANQDHKLCSSYPETLLVPHSITDDDLEKVSLFRSARRFPAVVWRHSGNGAVLARCSQPEVGWLGWRSSEDEKLVQAVADACAFDCGDAGKCFPDDDEEEDDFEGRRSSVSVGDIKDLSKGLGEVKKVLIIDARSYAAAFGNRARGGGVECQEYYPNTEILFMNLANIHTIRKSFQSLRLICNSQTDQTGWFQALDGTRWYSHMSGLLKAAVRCARALETEGRPVIVHCSDGWDRTPQIVSLAQLMLDPYYRSVEGFQVLVEKEWLDFGHKMADRCGNAFATSDLNERSPVFLQWLDCVHQLLLQFPCHFEFNMAFLSKLAQHAYSQLFGDFLCNSLFERRKNSVYDRTRSVWNFLKRYPYKFRNLLYTKTASEEDEEKPDMNNLLVPRCEIRDLLLWKEVYVSSEFRPSGSGGAGSENNVTASSSRTASAAPTPPVIKGYGCKLQKDKQERHAKSRSTSGGTFSDPGGHSRQSLSGEEDEDDIEIDGEDGIKMRIRASRQQRRNEDGQRLVDEIVSRASKKGSDQVNNCDSTDGQPAATKSSSSKSEEEETSCPDSLKLTAQKALSSSRRKYDHVIESSTDTLVPDDEKRAGSASTNSVKPQATNVKSCQDKKVINVGGGEAPKPSVKITGGGKCADSNSCCSGQQRRLSNRSDGSCLFPRSRDFDLMDADGLISHVDPVQRRLVEVFSAHVGVVNSLKRELYITHMTLERQRRLAKEESSKTMMTESMEDENQLTVTMKDLEKLGIFCDEDLRRFTKAGGCGNPGCGIGSEVTTTASSSDGGASWENVDEKDAKPTLWVPDHAVAACMNCQNSFWFGRRKHHCRSCGQLFCAECSNNLTPIPREQLYHPVRVCDNCFVQIESERMRLEEEEETKDQQQPHTDDSSDDLKAEIDETAVEAKETAVTSSPSSSSVDH